MTGEKKISSLQSTEQTLFLEQKNDNEFWKLKGETAIASYTRGCVSNDLFLYPLFNFWADEWPPI